MITAITMMVFDKLIVSREESSQAIQSIAWVFSLFLSVAQDIALIHWLWKG